MIIAVDYDQTLFNKSYPEIGTPKYDIVNKVKEFQKAGAEIVLWTCREGKALEEALERVKDLNIKLDAVNENAPSEEAWIAREALKGHEVATRKIYADFYLDDKARNLDIFLNLDVKKTIKEYEHERD